VKTGRLLKFLRPGGEVHAYLYRDGARFRASVYLMADDAAGSNEPLQQLAADSESDLEAAVRACVERRFPR
jgi:DNA replication initiation complex subunit (GINS family)